ncbi:hypothetical protein FKM82_002364 [Ascaphus truei]
MYFESGPRACAVCDQQQDHVFTGSTDAAARYPIQDSLNRIPRMRSNTPHEPGRRGVCAGALWTCHVDITLRRTLVVTSPTGT